MQNREQHQEALQLDDRESGAPRRHRRHGREVLQDQGALLLRPVVPVHAGQPGHRPWRGHL